MQISLQESPTKLAQQPANRIAQSATCAGRGRPSGSARGGFALVALALLLAGCSSIPFFGKKDEDPEARDINSTEQQMYRQAQGLLRSASYSQAIDSLQRLEARFPFGRYAEQAQLEIIYAHYMAYDQDAARASANRFIRLHPQHSSVDYAYYLRGLASYNKNAGLFDRLFTTDAAKRDINPAREAFADFTQMLSRFPDSNYAPDARARMLYLRDMLARHEVHVADYYMRRGAYVAGANRARYVVENYPRSASVDDALAVLIEANYKLGLEDAANDALRVLAANYPDYPAFDDSGNLVLTEAVRNRDRSWLNLVTLGLLDRPDVPPPLAIRHPQGFEPSVRNTATADSVNEAGEANSKKPKGRFSWLPFVD